MRVKSNSTIIVGGGLAGLAATTALASRRMKVTLLEARPRLGGRASSFNDPASGQLLDACQHVSMGCCTNLHHFFASLGVADFLEPQHTLWFMTPDRRVSRFRRDPWPAPFHLGRALASSHYLSRGEKLRIGWGLAMMMRMPKDADPPLLEWLLNHRQTPRTIDRFWGIVLISALNESVDRVGFKYARKVFKDGFLTHRDGFLVEVPRVPLGRLYGEELRGWLSQHNVTVEENAAVRTVVPDNDGVTVILRDGRAMTADNVVLAVPFDRVLDLLPKAIAETPFFARISQIQPSPITSLHLWFDREVFDYPHVVLVDCLGQWVFRRDNGYVQIVVSAARNLKGVGREEIERRVVEEIQSLFPKAAAATLLRSKVVTEHTATFSAVPGVDALRPPQATPIPRLFLAGDWTATGWPATMEGAVRSGYLAAEAMLYVPKPSGSGNASLTRSLTVAARERFVVADLV